MKLTKEQLDEILIGLKVYAPEFSNRIKAIKEHIQAIEEKNERHEKWKKDILSAIEKSDKVAEEIHDEMQSLKEDNERLHQTIIDMRYPGRATVGVGNAPPDR